MHLAMAPLLAATAAAGDGRATPQPNILLIVADDLGYADVDFQTPNRSVVQTPHLRAAALRGLRLTNHHVQPFCSPTRATLMTGRHVLRYGLQNTVIWPADAFSVPQNETFLSQNLRAAGYYTAQYGKWHLGLHKNWSIPTSRGFDEQYGYYLGGEDYWTHSRSGGIDWHRNETLVTDENGTYSAELLGDAAVDFVTRRGPLGPWFLYLPFQSVHSPLQAMDIDLALYTAEGLNGNQRTRAAMVTALDRQVGKLAAALDASAQTERTVIVFTSDNGAPNANAFDMGDDPEMVEYFGFGGPEAKKRPPAGSGDPPHGGGGGSNWPLSGWKHWVFEGGVRSAAFVVAPQLAHLAGRQHGGLFHSVDWLPTLAALAGAGTAANLPLDGVDILPALAAGGSGSPRTEIPVEIAACGPEGKTQTIVDGPQAAIIVGDLKLIVDCFWRSSRNVTTEHVQLYNLTADLAERDDLSGRRPGDVARLAERLAWWEAQSVPPYALGAKEAGCGNGKPRGTPPHWAPWC